MRISSVCNSLSPIMRVRVLQKVTDLEHSHGISSLHMGQPEFVKGANPLTRKYGKEGHILTKSFSNLMIHSLMTPGSL